MKLDWRGLKESRLVRRVLASTGANAYGQATTIGIQLLSLPMFLSKWDLATYGQWIVLSALPGYILMADVGMVSAAGNNMTMLVGEGNTKRANQVFQSALAFVLSVCAAATLAVMLAIALWPASSLPTADSRGTLAALSLGVIVALVGGLPEAVYRATHRYALGTTLSQTIRLLEWGGSLAALWWFGDFLSVAIGALIPRVAGTLLMIVHAAATTPDFRWGFADATREEIKRCVRPAVSFMAFPAANALNFQGMTLVAAAVLGPAATVVFNTYRTMARVTVQATGAFGNAMWTEFARVYGQGDLPRLALLYRRSRRLGYAVAAAAGVVVYLVAPTLLQVWSKGHIAFDPALMTVAMVYAATAGGWHVARTLLLSTNEHGALAGPFLIASVLILPVAWALGKGFGLVGVMLAMLMLEAAMLAYCSWLAHRLLQPPSAPLATETP